MLSLVYYSNMNEKTLIQAPIHPRSMRVDWRDLLRLAIWLMAAFTYSLRRCAIRLASTIAQPVFFAIEQAPKPSVKIDRSSTRGRSRSNLVNGHGKTPKIETTLVLDRA